MNNDDQVLILGGGFTGLFTAMHLASSNCPLPITLVDRETRFIFKPLLYELLSNEVSVNVVWPRYEELLGDRDVTYVLGNIENSKSILAEESDPEFREMAKEELDDLLPEQEKLEEELKFMLIPKDPDDSKNCILEIRAGTGGDEAALFVGDLLKMYEK